MVTIWQDYYGKGNLKKFYWNAVGKKFQIGNAYSLTEKRSYSCLCMWTIPNLLERSKILTQRGRHSLTLFFWVALNENVK